MNIEGGDLTELLKYAFTGFNLIPTMMLILILLYWVVAIIGLLDLELFDFELDLDGGDGNGLLDAIALFLKIGEVPFGLVLSLIVLNFWIISMFLIYLPVAPDHLLYLLLLLGTLTVSIMITRYELLPLGRLFRTYRIPNDLAHKVMDRRCTLLSEVSVDQMGQARIEQRGAGVVINVKAEFEKETFVKDEVAFVFRKDDEKDLYYITKPIFKNDIFDQTEGK